MPGDEVQALLIQQAQDHFAEGRYEASVRILRRVVESYPRSPRQAEARWWLARSYEQSGYFKAALAEYRLLAAQPPTSQSHQVSYGPEAKNRIAALEQRLGKDFILRYKHIYFSSRNFSCDNFSNFIF